MAGIAQVSERRCEIGRTNKYSIHSFYRENLVEILEPLNRLNLYQQAN